MNHLRDLLEHMPANVGVDPHIHAADAANLLHAAQGVAATAQCFWLGDMDAIGEIHVVPELARLPFKEVWFEGELPLIGGQSALIGLLAQEQEDGYVECFGFTRYQHQWALMFAAKLDMEQGSAALSSDLPDVVTEAQYCLYVLRAFCCAMNCTNVVRQKHHADAKIQVARAKRGKAPLFSYWTLVLNGKRKETRKIGGTHSTPRVHLRRGHPRQYAPGKWTWVQPHAVGNRDRGMVHKDYIAGRAMSDSTLKN